MIDAKSFIEFFEKECNVKFIDAETGESALDIIAKKEEIEKNSHNRSDYDEFSEENNQDDK